MASYNISGKVFFITGGASGIGLSLAEGLLSKQGKVFFIDLDETKGRERLENLVSRFGSENVGFAPCDVTDRQRFEESFQEAVTKFGQVDGMINNAGLCAERKPKLAVDINILGTIYGTEIATAHMRKDTGGKGGRVVNLSSFVGLHSVGTIPVYCGTKHFVRAYTESYAKHEKLQEMGIEYAVLLPDAVETEGLSRLADNWLYEPAGFRESSSRRVQPLDEFTKKVFDFLVMGNINGALVMLTSTKNCFMTLEPKELEDLQPSS